MSAAATDGSARPRSRSPAAADAKENAGANHPDAAVTGQEEADRVVQAAGVALQGLCEEARIPESHGFMHASCVLRHTERALAAGAALVAPQRAVTVRLAALLHDADDRKYFPKCPKGTFPNAERMAREALGSASAATFVDERVVAEMLKMIGWVSCSKNGNAVPPEAAEEPELLWPRWADRLEAAGEIGIVRCWQYNAEVGAPLVVEGTPRPTTEAEVWALATPERFAAYQASGGGSASMLDHYYDKLLQLGRPPREDVQNSYLEAEMSKRAAPLVKVCLTFGQTSVLPLDDKIIGEMAAALGA